MRQLALALAFGAELIFGATETVVATGLNNPRGIAFGPDGSLYVAEAGTGGAGPCNAPDSTCVGTTGSITRIWPAKKNQPSKSERIVVGLPSLKTTEGEIVGVSDIAFKGGAMFATIGLGENPTTKPNYGPLAAQLATLIQITGKNWRVRADLGRYEEEKNPDGRLLDSNPNGLLVDGNSIIVVDAGGNSILKVDANGKVSTLAWFPQRDGADFVPTAVVKGPDGAYYISQLTGYPFTLSANIYRFVPGSAPVIFLSDLWFVTDLAFDSHGNLYVLEIHSLAGFQGDGKVIKVAPNGDRTTIVDDLDSPTSIAVDNSGAVYVSVMGTATTGEILKIVS